MMAEFKMTAIIKLSQNEWVKFFFRVLGKMAESKMAEFKMAAIKSEEWMSLSQIELVWVRVRGVRVFLSESERR